MKAKILMIAVFLAFTASVFAQVKPSNMSPATVAAFKAKLGVQTQAEADVRYPLKSDSVAGYTAAEVDAMFSGLIFDSIPEFTTPPMSGNIWINTSTDMLYYKSGNYWYSLTKTDSIHVPSSLHTNLISCWESDGTTWVDKKSGRNGVVNGQAVLDSAGSFLPYALALNISDENNDDFVRVADNAAYHLTGAFAISVWYMETEASLGDPPLVAQYKENNYTAAYSVRRITSTNLVQLSRGGMTPSVASTSSITLATNQWHHILVVFDGTGTDFYVNGIKRTRVEQTGTPSDVWSTGLDFGAVYTTNRLHGYIQQAAMWDKVPTDEEALILYNSGNGKPFWQW